jgi:hypothetical protein
MSPAEEYAKRLAARQARVAELERVHIRLGNLRLATFLVAVAIAWLAFGKQLISPWWLVIPLTGFILLVAQHSKALRRRALAERAVLVYESGLARIADKWTELGRTGDEFNDVHHVYASDLDLFGRGGLFQLLSLARTRMGEQTLAGWLLAPSTLDEVRGRQAAVLELRDNLDLREDVAVLGEDAGIGVRPRALLQWAESPNLLEGRWLTAFARTLAAGAVLTAVAWAIWNQPLPFLIVAAVESVVFYRLRRGLNGVLHETEHAFENLDLLSAVLARFEQEGFTSPRLRNLTERLTSHQQRGSIAIGRLRKLVDLSMSRDNLFLRLLDIPLMYSVQVAIAVENWRREHGRAVRRWLEVIGEIEALLSLSGYSYEHPADPLPQFVEGSARFEAEQLGHPLLSEALCVHNDVSVGGTTRVLMVSGSNMSGKSTLLRAVGINTVLALAGAPVRARRLRLSLLQVGASIRINDSLQEGNSRFYAEIKRLRQIYDLTSQMPRLLFLLDELLQGTNSQDRRIGAEGIIRALLEREAIGLVSTHDLALTNLADSGPPALHNVHFQDELVKGQLKFDYRLREGVVAHSNGLALMRSIGLNV